MDSEKFLNHKNCIEIPDIFRVSDTGDFFDTCLTCDKYLLTRNIYYIIEKVIVRHEVIFEYAMCINCIEEMRLRLSQQTLQRVGNYYEQHVNMVKRYFELIETAQLNVEGWLSNCLIKGTPAYKLTEYQIYAACNGKNLEFNMMPYMVGEEATSEINELISSKSRDELDDFSRQYFGLPPEWQKALNKSNPVLI